MTAEAGSTTTLTVHVAAGDRLHLWLRPRSAEAPAVVTVGIGGERHALAVEGPSRAPLPQVFTSAAAGEATLDWSRETTEVSLVYLFSPATVARDGIRLVWASPEARLDPRRYRLHFGPLFGWMNDPNGLCEVNGVTHLFYQHNPHGRRWDTMHWGHAVSRDGLSWVHLPIALLPREELLREAGRQGGAFSGNARARPDGTLRLFYTDREDSRQPTREWQLTAVMEDGLAAGPATVLLDAHPPVPEFRNDWRDPFVFEGPDGRLKMLLGGADHFGAVVLLYETADPEGTGGWRFVDVLMREDSVRIMPAECPCMIRLEGADAPWVLIFALIGSREEATGRRNLTRTFVGRFDGRAFVPLDQHAFDIGPDCYAVQVWRAADGPRAIGWAANWTDVHAGRDFETAMTLPRRLLWQDGRVLTPPIAAVDTLRVGAARPLGPGERVALDDGLAEVALTLVPEAPFTLTLDHPVHPVSVTFDGLILELHDTAPAPRCLAPCPTLGTVRLFVDVGLIELYADGGAACCTRRVDSTDPFTAVHLDAAARMRVAEVWRLHAPLGRAPLGPSDPEERDPFPSAPPLDNGTGAAP